jgi:hypothetical protein
MGSRAERAGGHSAEKQDVLPEIRPCEAGWLFCDGVARAIARRGERADGRGGRVDDEDDA